MKAIIGVDACDHYKQTLDLLARLQLPNLDVDLVHAIESTALLGSFPPEEMAHVLDLTRAEAAKLLDAAQDFACSLGIRSSMWVEEGIPARVLADRAEALGAALIGVRSNRKGPFASLFLGSVSRGLTLSAHHSVLVAKAQLRHRGKLKAVLATDHSDYNERCVDKLLDLGFHGFERLVVLHAYEINDREAAVLHMDPAKLGGFVESWIEDQVCERTHLLVERLKLAGLPAEPLVVEGHPNEAIQKAMADSDADLLILGAHGRGFVDPLGMGSTCLHQIMVEPYSSLVLRAPLGPEPVD